mmetsp:Transcript_60031/g.141613  ORF Transcript_60031/g.141613 Transcript_60031/m.141613 type:complete len:171 (+) Transcript_60031:99-611(+)
MRVTSIPRLQEVGGLHRTGFLSGIESPDEVTRVLGVQPCAGCPGKVVRAWIFRVDGVVCGIWDWKGSQKVNAYSTFGPAVVMETLFGPKFAAGDMFEGCETDENTPAALQKHSMGAEHLMVAKVLKSKEMPSGIRILEQSASPTPDGNLCWMDVEFILPEAETLKKLIDC